MTDMTGTMAMTDMTGAVAMTDMTGSLLSSYINRQERSSLLHCMWLMSVNLIPLFTTCYLIRIGNNYVII